MHVDMSMRIFDFNKKALLHMSRFAVKKFNCLTSARLILEMLIIF